MISICAIGKSGAPRSLRLLSKSSHSSVFSVSKCSKSTLSRKLLQSKQHKRRVKTWKSPQPLETSRRSSQVSSANGTRQKATLAPSVEAAAAEGASAQQGVVRKSVRETLEEVLRKPRTIPIPRWITPRHSSITLSELFGHSSFILVAFSYALDDFLMLRIVAVAGSTAMLFFTYFHPHGRVLWLPFKWNCLFIAINSYRIGKVLLDRYFSDRLTPELLELRREHFYLMDSVDFYRLVRLGTLQEFKKGDLLTAQGENNRYVRLVVNGQLRVLRDGKLVYTLEAANFVSEAGLHAGLLLPGKMESCCTVVADSPHTRVLTWDRTELVELMERYPSLRGTLKAIFSWDIMHKLKGQRTLLASGIIDDPEEWTELRNRQTFHRYAAILHNILSQPKYLKEERKELDKYRMIHHIDDEHHNMALREVGWTPEEFDSGRKKELENDEEEVVVKHDFRWYVHDLLMRIFG